MIPATLKDRVPHGLRIAPGELVAYLTIIGVSAVSGIILLAVGRHHSLPPPGGGSFPFVTFSLTVVIMIAVMRPLYLVVRLHPAPLRQLADDVYRFRGWLTTIAVTVVILPDSLDIATRFKKLIPQLNLPTRWDLPIANFEHAVLGTDAWRLTHAVIGARGTIVLDDIYGVWHIVNIALLCWLVLTRDRRFQVQAVLAYQLSWLVVGGAFAIALASVGPCFLQTFTGDDRFAPLMQQLRQVDSTSSLHSMTAMRYLLASRGTDILGGGISAMPSLHVGIATMIVLIAFRQTKRVWVRGLAIGYLLAIYVGSIHFGWHYSLDGIVGGLSVVVIWLACGWFADRTIGRDVSRQTVAVESDASA